MKRRMLLLWLAGMPALVCAQEVKVTNCRTLAVAGNFLGPDEIIVNDLVCQKVKVAGANSETQTPKAQPGAAVSEGETPISVVDAAKAANKRVAAAEDAIKQKAAEPAEEEKPALPVGPMAPSVAPDAPVPGVEPEKAPAHPAGKPKMRLPVKPVAPEYDASAQPPVEESKPAVADATDETLPVTNSALSTVAYISEHSLTALAETPVRTETAGASADAPHEIVSRELAGNNEPAQQQAKPEEPKSAPAAESAQAAAEDHQAECGKNKWWKPWGKCKSDSERVKE
jgi:hypothetical protein